MIFDATEQFSNAQAITATAASTNVLDTGATGTSYGAAAAHTRDMGKGTPVPLTIRVVQSFNTLTSLSIAYQVATDAAFTSPVTIFTGGPYTLAQLAAGATHLLPDTIPVGANLRYHRLYYTVAGSNPTLGQITAGIVAGNQTNSIL